MATRSSSRRNWAEAAADLVLGAFCPGCGAAAVPLCAACVREVVPDARPIESSEFPAMAAGEHADTLRRLLVTWKDRGRHGLTHVLASHLAASVIALELEPPLTLIPVPTSRRSRRQRGSDVVVRLAQLGADRVRALGIPVTVQPVLAVVRSPADQTGLSAHGRQLNVDHSQRVVRRATSTGTPIVVDDIWTTGATARESVRALAEASMLVEGVAVVAVTPLRRT